MNVAVAYGQATWTAGDIWIGGGAPPTAWNAGGCCGTATDVAATLNTSITATDDIGYLKEMMDTLVSNYNIDEKRIYLTGWSNGAALVDRAVCELGDKIRAAIPYAGSILMKSLTRDNYMGAAIPAGDRVYDVLSTTPFFAGMDINFPKKTVTEFNWWDSSDTSAFKTKFFSCEKGSNVPMLIINGYQDIVVDVRGYIVSNPKTTNMLTAWSPAKFNYWTFANLNEKDTPTMTTPFSSFQ